MAEARPKEDRRSRRTRRLVIAAMTELLLEKPWDEITVQAILDRADIGRATFYHHFRDKLDVVDAVTAEMFDEARSGSPEPPPSAPLPALPLFRHAAERFRSIRAMLDTPGGEVFWAESYRTLVAELERSLATPSGRMRAGVPDAVAAQFVAGAFIATLKWWIRAGMPYPPEQMASMFESLMPPLANVSSARRPSASDTGER